MTVPQATAQPTTRPSTTLAEFVSGLRYEDLPERTRERTRDLLFDAIGNAVAGHLGEETPQVAALARALGASDESTVIGGAPLSMAGATVLNGFLISAITAMDAYHPAACHVTPEVVPPALAIAERDGASGKELLTAVAAGFEVTTRVCIGLDFPAFRRNGWHSPGVAGPFGGAAAVGWLLRLDADRQRAAFGLAGSQAAGTYAAWGTPTVKFHQCRGALSGLMAGLLAEQGFLSSPEILAHPDGGIFNTYSDGGKPDEAVADLGQHWELEQISLRLWTSFPSALITGLLDLIGQHDLRVADVERARVYVDSLTFNMHSIFTVPRGRFDAMLSLPFVTSVVFHDRDAWLDQFVPASYTDAGRLAFAREHVEVLEDSSLPRTSARAEIRTQDGRVLETRVDDARGTPGNPASREDLIAKFRKCTDGRLPGDQAERALDLLLRLEQVGNVRELTEQLRGR